MIQDEIITLEKMVMRLRVIRTNREIALAITKLQEAIHWLQNIAVSTPNNEI